MRQLAAVLLAFATMGCMMQSTTRTVHWDLSESHAKTAFGWPSGAGDVYEIDQADATVRLPGDRTFEGSGVKLKVLAEGDQAQILAVMYPKTTLDDGYRQAQDLAKRWGLKTDGLETWHQQVIAGRARGVKDRDEPFYTTMAGSPLAPGGPTPFVQLLDSFDDQRPLVLDLEFQWM
jgi:hypothetical protein